MALTHREPVLHGGDLDAARAKYPEAPEPWIDLSTGINPNPYPIPDLAFDTWSRLPQSSQDLALRLAAAHRYGANNIEMLVAAPGTQALIQIIPRLVGRSQVAVLSPTYKEHAAAWRREDHDVVEVSDLNEIGAARVVVVVNPNNPTGRIVQADTLRELAASLNERGGLLVIDEAFADVAAPDTSLVPNLAPATIVLRSFGKMYGLPGLRLGFAIAHRSEAERLRSSLGPWAVSVPAMSIGATALGDDLWREQALQDLQNGARRLDAMLETCGGCVVGGGTMLFRLVTHPMAEQLADVLGRHGILVRRFPDEPTWLRFGLPGLEPEWQRLEEALLAAREAAKPDTGLPPS